MKKPSRRSRQKQPLTKQEASQSFDLVSESAREGGAGVCVDQTWLTNIWPQERDFICRPDRLKYVRKIVKPTGCVFCEAKVLGPCAESLLLYSDDEAMVVLNKYPYNTGHLLVLPTRHCGDPLALSEVEYLKVQQLVRASIHILKECYGFEGLNLGVNLGAAAGAGIPDHLHYHLLPRWAGDTNFFPLIAETKVLIETLEDTYARLIAYYREGIESILTQLRAGSSI